MSERGPGEGYSAADYLQFPTAAECLQEFIHQSCQGRHTQAAVGRHGEDLRHPVMIPGG